jgi:hypothetical protein
VFKWTSFSLASSLSRRASLMANCSRRFLFSCSDCSSVSVRASISACFFSSLSAFRSRDLLADSLLLCFRRSFLLTKSCDSVGVLLERLITVIPIQSNYRQPVACKCPRKVVKSGHHQSFAEIITQKNVCPFFLSFLIFINSLNISLIFLLNSSRVILLGHTDTGISYRRFRRLMILR